MRTPFSSLRAWLSLLVALARMTLAPCFHPPTHTDFIVLQFSFCSTPFILLTSFVFQTHSAKQKQKQTGIGHWTLSSWQHSLYSPESLYSVTALGRSAAISVSLRITLFGYCPWQVSRHFGLTLGPRLCRVGRLHGYTLPAPSPSYPVVPTNYCCVCVWVVYASAYGACVNQKWLCCQRDTL